MNDPPDMHAHLVVALGLVAIGANAAHTETRGTIRVGMLPLDLEASADTPLFGAQVQEAVDDFNAAAAARGTATRVDAGDVGIATNLYSIAPGLEFGGRRYAFRLEGVLGKADDLMAIGIGIYPIGLQGTVARDVTLYGSAGGILSWLDRAGSGDVGGLVTARAAFGARISDRFLIELGYNAFVLGGNVNRTRLDDMMSGSEPPALDGAISAGEARGLYDVSVGLSF